MTWDLIASEEYIRFNTLDNEDFIDADDDRKTALLNVSSRELTRKFTAYTIPNEAVYLYANTLASAFNDTNKYQRQGVAGFSVKGISFTFKNWTKKDFDALVPPEVVVLISKANNGVKLTGGRSVRWTVL